MAINKQKVKTVKQIKITPIEEKPFVPYWYDEYNDERDLKPVEFTTDDRGSFTYFIAKNKGIPFQFSITQLEHCCAILELGNIDLHKDIPLEAIDEIFQNIFAKTKRTIVINTNGKLPSVNLEKYLVTSKYFTLVKEFKNNGSGNIIKMWVSNN